MVKVDALFLISMLIFFIIHLGYTQKIYSNNTHNFFLTFSVLFPAVLITFNFYKDTEDLLKVISFSSVFLIYYMLLLLIKKTYTRINNYLVAKKWINKGFQNKNFTFVHWDDIITDYWDEKLATKPSWFDKLVTFLLLILPLLVMSLIYSVITAFFIK